jgi:hypothetical protein
MFILPIILTACFGLAHEKVRVPPFEINCRVISQVKNHEEVFLVHMAVPEFYGQSDAFLALVDSSFDDGVGYDRREFTVDSEGTFQILLREENRYIGFPLCVFPFPPSEDTSRSRTVLFWFEGGKNIYRIKLKETRAIAERTDISLARLQLPDYISGPTVDTKSTNPDTEFIEAKIEFYRGIKWEPAPHISIQDVKRTDHLDVLNFDIQITIGS